MNMQDVMARRRRLFRPSVVARAALVAIALIFGFGWAGCQILNRPQRTAVVTPEPQLAHATEAQPEATRITKGHPMLAKLPIREKYLPLVTNEGAFKKYKTQRGEISYYHEPQKTASGLHFDPDEMMAAHRTLPLGTIVRVTNTENRRSVVVSILDRGPFIDGRILDVSTAAARRLRMREDGVVTARVEVLAYPAEDE